jgi:PII-like signaling protein
MADVFLKIYVGESQKHHGVLLYEWLLEQAKKMDIPGGSAFRAIAGFGRHAVIHEDSFFELAGKVPVEVGFAVSDADAQRLLDLVRREGLRLFYVKTPAEHGLTG